MGAALRAGAALGTTAAVARRGEGSVTGLAHAHVPLDEHDRGHERIGLGLGLAVAPNQVPPQLARPHVRLVGAGAGGRAAG